MTAGTPRTCQRGDRCRDRCAAATAPTTDERCQDARACVQRANPSDADDPRRPVKTVPVPLPIVHAIARRPLAGVRERMALERDALGSGTGCLWHADRRGSDRQPCGTRWLRRLVRRGSQGQGSAYGRCRNRCGAVSPTHPHRQRTRKRQRRPSERMETRRREGEKGHRQLVGGGDRRKRTENRQQRQNNT